MGVASVETMRQEVEQVTIALDQVETWRQRTNTESGYDDGLNLSEIEISGQCKQFPASEVEKLAVGANTVTIEVRRGTWDASFRAAKGRFGLQSTSGEVIDAFDGSDLEAASSAIEEERARDLFALCGSFDCQLHIAIGVEDGDRTFSWFRRSEAFVQHLESGKWFNLVHHLYSPTNAGQLVLQDCDSIVVQCGGLTLHGPETWPAVPVPIGKGELQPAARYAAAFFSTEKQGLPLPTFFWPVEHVDGHGHQATDLTDRLSSLMGRVAHALVWLWLAESFKAAPSGRVSLVFEGARQVVIALDDLPQCSDPSDDLAFWRWAVGSSDALRREAVQQAASLSLRNANDLETAAVPTHRTAKYLARLAQQGAVAEALATRRSVRQAAMESARGTANLIQQAARAVVDRVITLMIGALGVLFAHSGELLATGTSIVLLLAVGGLILVTGVVAFSFEFPNVARARLAFARDLDRYRDTMEKEDIEDIKGMSTLESSGTTLARAQLLVGILLTFSLLAVLVLIVYIVLVNLIS